MGSGLEALLPAIITGTAGLGAAALGKNQTVTSNTSTSNTMDPLYKILSPYLMGQFVNAAPKMEGWGGSKMGGWNPALNEQLLAMLGKALPGIIGGMNTTPPDPRKSRLHQTWFGPDIFG